jgi:hypothetical protein
MENELIVIEEKSVAVVFQKDGSEPIIARLREALDSFVVPDVTTRKGRDEIKSFARKFATSKTLLDGHGKALKEQYKVKVDIIDAERKKLKDTCDVLRDEARKPVTEWEEAEKERVADIEARIEGIKVSLDDIAALERVNLLTSEKLAIHIKDLKAISIDESFEEFELAATKVRESVLTQLEAKFIVTQHSEKEKAEAERLEKERLEREQKDREEKIAKEAAEEATKEAEEKARAEAEEVERKATEEKDRLEKEKLEESLRAETAEKDKLEAKEKHDKDLADAVKETEERLKKEEAEEAERLKKKAENKAHRGKINRAAKLALIKQGFSDDVAEEIITVIAKGLIDHITINY